MNAELLQLICSGLALGASYALIALGFVVIYQSSQIFNFAHGEFLTLGGFAMVSLLGWGLPWPVALVGAMALTGGASALIERVVIRPMIGRPVFVTIILTLFVAYILRALVVIVWGADVRGMPTPWATTGTVNLLGARILHNALGAMLAGGVAMALFFALRKYTRLGVGMRAASRDQEVALALGIPVGRVFMATWFLAGTFAALAGVFLSMFPHSLDANLGLVALKAFPAVIVGGLTSALGAALAGLLLGVSEVLAQRYLEPALGELGKNIHAVFPYLIMVIFLVARPHGLFGHKDVKRL